MQNEIKRIVQQIVEVSMLPPKLIIRIPKTTKYKDVEVFNNYLYQTSKPGYVGSPYFWTQKIECDGINCMDCFENDCKRPRTPEMRTPKTPRTPKRHKSD